MLEISICFREAFCFLRTGPQGVLHCTHGYKQKIWQCHFTKNVISIWEKSICIRLLRYVSLRTFRFFEEAVKLGALYVDWGSDKTIFELKGRKIINKDAERLYMVKALHCVRDVWISSGCCDGLWKRGLRASTGYFLCRYQWLHSGNESVQRGVGHWACGKPSDFRSEIAGPFANGIAPGVPNHLLSGSWQRPAWLTECQFDLSGLGDRHVDWTHERAQRQKQDGHKFTQKGRGIVADVDPYQQSWRVSKVALLCWFKTISDSQDQLSLLLTALNKLNYDNGYRPISIESVTNGGILNYVAEYLYLVALPPRPKRYDVLGNTNINYDSARNWLIQQSVAGWLWKLKKTKPRAMRPNVALRCK